MDLSVELRWTGIGKIAFVKIQWTQLNSPNSMIHISWVFALSDSCCVKFSQESPYPLILIRWLVKPMHTKHRKAKWKFCQLKIAFVVIIWCFLHWPIEWMGQEKGSSSSILHEITNNDIFSSFNAKKQYSILPHLNSINWNSRCLPFARKLRHKCFDSAGAKWADKFRKSSQCSCRKNHISLENCSTMRPKQLM